MEAIIQACFFHMMPEYTFGQRRTADVAETYKKDSKLVGLLRHDTFIP